MSTDSRFSTDFTVVQSVSIVLGISFYINGYHVQLVLFFERRTYRVSGDITQIPDLLLTSVRLASPSSDAENSPFKATSLMVLQ